MALASPSVRADQKLNYSYILALQNYRHVACFLPLLIKQGGLP